MGERRVAKKQAALVTVGSKKYKKSCKGVLSYKPFGQDYLENTFIALCIGAIYFDKISFFTIFI